MDKFETGKHLFCPPKYKGIGNNWVKEYFDAIVQNHDLSWDISAILSILSFGYVCGNRTLLNEVKRQPWLSTILADSSINLEPIPPHGRLFETPNRIAKRLLSLLLQEALSVCQGRDEIYVLLSGGLDSRIIAGILVGLFQKNKIPVKPISLTWGEENSRDVVYARATAKILGIKNIHLDISPQNLYENIFTSADLLAGLVSPIHLHRMSWCSELGKEAIILNGSYGDSIGRAEFSRKHILELDFLQPSNSYDLLDKHLLQFAFEGLQKDLEELRNRTPNAPKYVLCEHEMQCHYMRGLIAHSMNLINYSSNVYHMFTAPEVYSYMWSIHPSARTNAVYANLLDLINPKLSEIPWARTNKPIRRNGIEIQRRLNKEFHHYTEWIINDIYDGIYDMVDPRWFKDTGIFNPEKIDSFRIKAKENPPEYRFDLLLWLCSFRVFAEKTKEVARKISEPVIQFYDSKSSNKLKKNKLMKIRILLRQDSNFYGFVAAVRKIITKMLYYILYPPTKMRPKI